MMNKNVKTQPAICPRIPIFPQVLEVLLFKICAVSSYRGLPYYENLNMRMMETGSEFGAVQHLKEK